MLNLTTLRRRSLGLYHGTATGRAWKAGQLVFSKTCRLTGRRPGRRPAGKPGAFGPWKDRSRAILDRPTGIETSIPGSQGHRSALAVLQLQISSTLTLHEISPSRVAPAPYGPTLLGRPGTSHSRLSDTVWADRLSPSWTGSLVDISDSAWNTCPWRSPYSRIHPQSTFCPFCDHSSRCICCQINVFFC